MNLLNTVKDLLTDALMDKVGDMIGLSSRDTKSAMDTFLPGLLGSIAHKGRTVEGAGSILDIINKDKTFKDDSFFNLDNVLSSPDKSKGFLEMGSKLLGMLFGNRQSGLIDFLSRKAGIKSSMGTKLLSFLVPIAFRKIAEIVTKKNYDARGLSHFFAQESKSLLGMVPGLDKVLGDETKSSYNDNRTYQEEKSGGGGWWKWLIPLLILLGLLWLLTRSGCNNEDTTTTTTTTEKVTTVDNTEETVKHDAVNNSDNNKTSTQTHITKTTMLQGFNVDAKGNIVDRNGNVLYRLGSYGLDHNGNLLDGNSKIIARAGSFGSDVLDKLKSNLGKYSTIKLTIDENGNLVDPTGKILYKKGEYSEKGGFYYDRQGNRLGRIWTKIVKAVKKTVESMKMFFGNMLTKKEGVPTRYTLNNITFKKDDHRIKTFSKAEVEGLALALKANPNSKIVVKVYSNEGDKVSKLRANVVQDMLIALGVKKGQISFKGMGNSDKAKANIEKVEIIVD